MAPVIESLDRRLVAVMFTDMVGYTALMQTDERLALEKRNRYVRALESHHAARGGTIVQMGIRGAPVTIPFDGSFSVAVLPDAAFSVAAPPPDAFFAVAVPGPA